MNGAAEPDFGGSGSHLSFGEAELASLLQSFTGHAHIALAVSGGADSTALMLLVHRWRTLISPQTQITVLTVDHRLRAASASEAARVAERATALGFAHHTLVWRGEKPTSDLQASAREARYALMTGYCRDHVISAIATAHNSNDQAETLIMRLRRGSGLDGLAGMAAVSIRGGVALLRPLLALSRARLEAFLKASGENWIEDPSNRSEIYERVRIRQALRTAATLGVSGDRLALSAKRLGRAREALETVTSEFFAKHLTLHESGYGDIALAPLLDAPEDIALRALSRLTLAFGGVVRAPQLSRIEAAYAKLATRPGTLTLGGCHFALRGESLLIAREAGRMRNTQMQVEPGETILWDRRFLVSLAGSAKAPFQLAALGRNGAQAVKAADGTFSMPHFAAMTLPALWRDGKLRFAPFAIFKDGQPDGWVPEASASFVNAALLFNARQSKAK